MGQHLEVLTEEPSMEAFLGTLLPRILPRDSKFEIHSFRGKRDLLKKLPNRLRGYAKWVPENYRIMVLIDRDNDDCRELKRILEDIAGQAGKTRLKIVNRIAIEELEAWYFGDWGAVCQAYPQVSSAIPKRSGYRDPDAVQGGTWERFEQIMKKGGYYKEGLAKVKATRDIAQYMHPERNRSRSFSRFHDVIKELRDI
ncbi:MAG: DUF4276 family protein [Gammaproteobacteria bacterium]|nr:DUF4276 family protein [Gammaproteobacteria bacterium]